MREFNFFCVFLLVVSTLMTSIYSVRLLKGVRMIECKVSYGNVMDYRVVVFPMSLLMVGAVVYGSIISWMSIDVPYYNLPDWFKVMLFFLVFGGLFMGLIKGESSGKGFLFHFLGRMWFLSYISRYIWVNIYMVVGAWSYKFWDGGWNEYVGAQGLYKYIFSFSERRIYPYRFKVYFFTFMVWGFIVCFLLF